jgi:hypothetical protein
MTTTASDRTSSLAWIALAAGLLPFVVVHLCYLLSVQAGIVPGCVPYFSGCTSISAAGRHGAAYFLFKGGMIPAAVLLAAYWALCRRWLLALGVADSAAVRSIAVIGVTSAAFLILYAVFLGSKGDFYNLMRRYGVTVYFSFSALAQLLLLRELTRLRGPVLVPRWIIRGKLTVVTSLLAVGLLSIPAGNLAPDRGQAQNVIEWIFAAVMSSYYVFGWRAWKVTGFRAGFNVNGA